MKRFVTPVPPGTQAWTITPDDTVAGPFPIVAIATVFDECHGGNNLSYRQRVLLTGGDPDGTERARTYGFVLDPGDPAWHTLGGTAFLSEDQARRALKARPTRRRRRRAAS